MKKTLLFLLGALALSGCGGGGGGGGTSTSPRVAYLNTSPDAGALTFSLNGSAKQTDLTFGLLTSFKDSGTDDYDLTLTKTGDPEILVDDAHSFTANVDNLTVAVGLQSPASDEIEKRLRFAYATIDRTSLTGSRARFIVLNALVRATGQVQTSLDFRNPGDNPQNTADGIAYGGFAEREVNSGTQSFLVRQSDTEGSLIASTSLTFAAGHVYLVLIEGQEGGSGALAPGLKVIDVPTRN